MRIIKRFESFISEEFTSAEPMVKPSQPDVKPGTTERPGSPSPIKRDRTSPVPSPAKAELKKASAEDVAYKFIDLINKSGDDIKKYAEIK